MGKQFNDGFKLVSTPLTTKSGEGSYSGANVPSTGTPSTNEGAYTETPTPGNLGPATNLVSGARAIMNAGFPAKGAAYLAGNIQQESGWRGQRDPWVLDDGAGTNKGLVSWNRGRITNAEKFLGKPLNNASNSDQIRWIKQEMHKSYPGAYKIFMNPNASDADLQRASYIYLGYGDVGSRFAYANKAYAALQKGGSTSQPAPAQVSSSPGLSASSKPQNKGNVLSEYITGDRTNKKHYAADHDSIVGVRDNYHDHLAFKDKETTLNAFNFFKSKGFKVTELGVSRGHSDGSLHYSGRAFDIPGAQWGGKPGTSSGPTEWAGSAKVRATLAQFLGSSASLGGSSNPAAQIASTPSPSGQMQQQLTPERTGQNVLVFDTGAGQSPPPAAPSGGGGGGTPAAPDDFTMVNNFIKKQLLLDLVYL